jgi:hypothetical protein
LPFTFYRISRRRSALSIHRLQVNSVTFSNVPVADPVFTSFAVRSPRLHYTTNEQALQIYGRLRKAIRVLPNTEFIYRRMNSLPGSTVVTATKKQQAAPYDVARIYVIPVHMLFVFHICLPRCRGHPSWGCLRTNLNNSRSFRFNAMLHCLWLID